ncbi:MAG: hypothetical protein K2X81_24405, partial [Candidatus Obscuribacterales bacterium]|nr:hypothetical protein [Candidatus Obscuribacterales bacterium]
MLNDNITDFQTPVDNPLPIGDGGAATFPTYNDFSPDVAKGLFRANNDAITAAEKLFGNLAFVGG